MKAFATSGIFLIFWISTTLTIPPSANAIQLAPLLSTCVDACQRGCLEIRKVQLSRELSDSNSDEFDQSVKMKDDQDPRSVLTAADTAAQNVIVGSLRGEWGDGLNIIGEEDDNDDIKLADPSLDKTMFDDDIGETADINLSDISVFVDPLDGTREFVEGRLDACQVLVGIAIDGEAVAGAIGIPFPDGGLSTDPTIVYGLADMGAGVLGSTLSRGPFPLDRNIDGIKYPRPHHATGDSGDVVMEACKKGAIKRFGGSNVIYGGAGNKILAAALGEVACSIQHKVGGAWDLCAPEAVLKAMGGEMTDLFGEPIDVYRKDSPARGNERGYLATPPGSVETFHKALAASLNALPEVQNYRQEVEK